MLRICRYQTLDCFIKSNCSGNFFKHNLPSAWPAPRHKFQRLRIFEILCELMLMAFPAESCCIFFIAFLPVGRQARKLAATANGSIFEGLVDLLKYERDDALGKAR